MPRTTRSAPTAFVTRSSSCIKATAHHCCEPTPKWRDRNSAYQLGQLTIGRHWRRDDVGLALARRPVCRVAVDADAALGSNRNITSLGVGQAATASKPVCSKHVSSGLAGAKWEGTYRSIARVPRTTERASRTTKSVLGKPCQSVHGKKRQQD